MDMLESFRSRLRCIREDETKTEMRIFGLELMPNMVKFRGISPVKDDVETSIGQFVGVGFSYAIGRAGDDSPGSVTGVAVVMAVS